jgi:hypothetical protein
MDRFSIFKKEIKNHQGSPAKPASKKKMPVYIICLIIFLAGILFITGEGWFPIPMGLLFAFAITVILIGALKFESMQKIRKMAEQHKRND